MTADRPPVELRDRVVVVTGAGQGLGRSHALLLGARGSCVVVNDLDDDGGRARADAVVNEIIRAGGRASAVYGSVTDPATAARLVDRATDGFGGLDAVVHNAGVGAAGNVTDVSLDDFDRLVDVHLRGAFLVSRAAFPVMADTGGGRLVFTVSSAGLVGNDFDGPAYAAAKAGAYGLMQSLAAEGASHGIAANAISPYACTPSTRPHLDERLHRWLDPAFVSPVVAWLVSGDCDVTGHVFSVAGGGVSRMFVGVTDGIRTTDPADLTPEVVRDHAAGICASPEWYLPRSTNEDFHIVFGRPEVTHPDRGRGGDGAGTDTAALTRAGEDPAR